jgi:hypothetical protein
VAYNWFSVYSVVKCLKVEKDNRNLFAISFESSSSMLEWCGAYKYHHMSLK